MAYGRPFRRYQLLALDAFERARDSGRGRVYLVMPPGSGKTALGLEIARRLGRRTLILSPNTAIQHQWLREWRDFQPGLVSAGPDAALTDPIGSLTYQALCNLDSQAAHGEEPDGDDGAHSRRRERQLIARGGDHQRLLGLLHANGRRLIERVAATGPWTIVLDECHHLLQMWGWLVRALLDEVGEDAAVIGLTATPPGSIDEHEAALYRELFGRADLEVPTPAVVREGNLAPYRDLVYLTTPLQGESRYIADEQLRFQELIAALHDPDMGSVSFLEWLRLRVFERASERGATVSWARFERDEPELATAALRYCFANGLPPPAGARLREPHRRPPAAGDWVALIDDYCTGHLRHAREPADLDAWERVRAALPGVGYRLTRQGIRAAATTVDRVLMLSAGKAAAALDILAAEHRALGPDLRALLLCDFERAAAMAEPLAQGVLDPQAGSAALLLQLVAGDPTGAELDPVLLTGRTVACGRATAARLVAWLAAEAPGLGVATRGGDGDVVVLGAERGWEPGRYVPLLTRYFEAGHTRCLIGTRGLLGEGWDACTVNALIDLTAVTTRTTVHQVRGRSLRLDPARPRKVAHNWDVVCVAPDHVKGAADYDRFVRKHRGYYGLTETGEIESGVSHVSPALSPHVPPPSDTFAALNRRMLDRADAREETYVRWRVGAPYRNALTETVRVRLARTVGPAQRRALRPPPGVTEPVGWGHLVAGAAAGTALLGAGAAAGLAVEGAAAAAAALATGAWWAGRAARERMAANGETAFLDDLGAAVVEALAAAGLVREDASVRVVAQPDGTYRCLLDGGGLEESRLFAEALDEVLAPLDEPRYLVPRFVDDPPRTAGGALWLLLRRRAGLPGRRVVYHAVPTVLAVNRQRAAAFGAAWNRHVSAGEPLFERDPRAQGVLAAQRGEDPLAVTTQMRTLWS